MCRLRELNPRSSCVLGERRTAPTFAPGSYKESFKRPQFYRAEGGALIRNVFLPGRGSVFLCPSMSFCTGEIPDIWRPPESLLHRVRRSGTQSVESLLAEIFVATGVRTPPTTLPNMSVCRLSQLGTDMYSPLPCALSWI